MMKKFVFLVMIIFLAEELFSQRDSLYREKEKPKINWRDRLYCGGNVGARFGDITFIDISPLLGVNITQRFSVGIGAIYNYYNYNYYGTSYKTTMYGGRIFGRYFVLENVFVQGGWDRINRDNPYSFIPDARIWIDNILVGGGARYPISRNIFVTGIVLFNLNQTPLSPYGNPIVQIGFIGGF
jgi:hypothetical protein